jgi:hypothetical protein
MKRAYVSEDLANLLRDTPFAALAESAVPVTVRGFTYPDLFRIGSFDSGYFCVKLRPANAPHVNESLRCLSSMQDPENLISRYVSVLLRDDTRILISQWVTGVQPFENAGHTLPEFFRRQARFNLHNPSDGPFTSMYSDGEHFDSIEELVDAEIDYHLGFFDVEDYRTAVIDAVQPLKGGLGCLVFEDMNPGNMFLTDKGEYVLIDTEWLHPGLNLHQFDHTNYFRFREPKWYTITEEAAACYAAYFGELRLDAKEANAQVRAYEVLAVVRSNTYWHFFQMEGMYEKTGDWIAVVLDHDCFL